MATDADDWDDRPTGPSHEARLAAAYEQLEAVLERVDLERDQEFAEQVIGALMETERAYTAAIKAGSQSDQDVALESGDRPG